MPTQRGTEKRQRSSGQLEVIAGLSRKVEKLLGQLPGLLDKQLQEHPHRTLGVTLGAGAALGVLASSRISRVLASGVVAYALGEWLRSHPFQSLLLDDSGRSENRSRAADTNGN